MSEQTKSAFPIPSGYVLQCQGGMDLRDYFAAKMLQAAASIPEELTGYTKDASIKMKLEFYYYVADMMMEARKGIS